MNALGQIDIFDLMTDEDKRKYSPKLSTDWKWKSSDYPKEQNDINVFSCFACGGGSTMGYKLAGCNVLGCVEIDEKMMKIYKKNHNPKFSYCMDIREFNKIPNSDLPPELFDLDILDGSPPCTTFSMAGQREKAWGKKKKFREGQTAQTLDDLSFVFIDTVRKLKPRVVIMENVEGLLLGEAWTYTQRIYKELKNAGYVVKHWLLKGEYMGVPQRRHRVFFIAARKELNIDVERLDMCFNYKPITYGEIKAGKGQPINPETEDYRILSQATKNDFSLADICERNREKARRFSAAICWDENVLPTIVSKLFHYRPIVMILERIPCDLWNMCAECRCRRL